MKKYSLSGPKQKLICIGIIIFLLFINYFTFFRLPMTNFGRYSFLIFTVILSVFYGYIIFSASVIIDPKNHLVNVRMLKNIIIDLKKVTKVVSEDHKVNNRIVKVIVFYNDNNQYIGEIDTFFGPKQDSITNTIINSLQEAI